jgi:ABC-2 type transport system ATP-binding protein
MADAVVVRNVSKTFRSGSETIKALDGVSLSIKEGEIFGLLGPNGAGKTTLISILAGVVLPDGGEASVLGFDCVREAKKAQKNLNVVSGFTGVLFSLSCDEALKYYSYAYNIKDADRRIDWAMKMTDVESARGQLAEDISSGMKQRFMIAKALLNDPKLLILDEPTVGLDVESAIRIREMIKQLRKEGRTILLTTHNMFEAEELCDRIAFINKGRIIAVGTAPELKKNIIGKRTIEVNCSDGQEVVGILSRVKGAEPYLHSPKLVHVNVSSYASMKEVMKALSASKSEIYNVSALEPTLEETYLKVMNEKVPKRKGKTGGESDV